MPRPTQVRWSTHGRLSMLHAAHVVAGGAGCVDAATEKAMAAPVTQINARLVSESLDVYRFWDAVIRTAAVRKDGPVQRKAAIKDYEQALLDAGGSELQSEQTASAIADLFSSAGSAFDRRFPKLNQQLELRGRPLREAWESYGPGLLNQISKKIWQGQPPDDWWPAKVNGYWVQPMRGGDGGVAPDGRFWIEAMLTDAHRELPEVLRIAYLVTLIAVDEHIRQRSGEQWFTLPWPEAVVVVVLDAAAELDLVDDPESRIHLAVRHWLHRDLWLGEILKEWSSQWHSTGAVMPVAVKALAKMIDQHRRKLADDIESAGLNLLDDEMLSELGLTDDD
ncbi:hypothetical protein [Crateriforma conspicua]|uniref:Uncharacterized protein n=2 Tax=Crateriforma TaxID=2714592 RepID=A0A5C6FRG8_9PLAN|nr:hypothetical protein [Crateriforma conspicua]TWU63086.1 hypothetical protein V7x_48240 [Crateriforma conspicua]